MEVIVTDHDNLPENSLVSIRFGSTRRQAPLDTVRDHPLKFPCALEACCEPLKIDVLQPVASARLVLHAHEERYKIGLDTKDKSLMTLGLSVQNSPGASMTPNMSRPDSASSNGPLKFQDTAASAREYLELHGLLRYVQALLHAVIQVRPKDPYAFMMQQLGAAQSRMSEFPINAAQAPKAPEPTQMSTPQEASPAAEFPARTTAAATTPPAAAPAKPSTATTVTPPMAADSTPVPVAPTAPAPKSPVSPPKEAIATAPFDIEKLRQQAKATLSEATLSGALQATLEEVASPRIKAKEAAASPSVVHREAPAASADREKATVEGIRLKAMETLSQATMSGKLAAALEEVVAPKKCLQQEEEKVATEQVTNDQSKQLGITMRNTIVDIDGLRTLALDTLGKASADGRLSQTLEDVLHKGTKEIDQLRELALHTLGQATDDGRLGQMLDAMANMQRNPAKPSTTQANVSKGCAQTSLAPPEIEELRTRVRVLLEQACESGALVSAIGSMVGRSDNAAKKDTPAAPSHTEEDIYSIKSRIRSLLEESCESGKLMEVLQSTVPSPRLEAQKAPTASEGMDEIKGRMKRLLEEACDSGKLSEVLQTITKPASRPSPAVAKPQEDLTKAGSVQELKERTRKLLENACESGQLATALEQLPRTPLPVAAAAADGPTAMVPMPPVTQAPPQEAKPTLAPTPETMPAPPCTRPPDELASSPPPPPQGPPPGLPPQDLDPKIDELRQRMRGLLERACDSGELANALSTLDNRSPASASAAPPPPPTTPAAAPVTAASKVAVAEAIADGAVSPELEKLRKHLCHEFATRAASGELDAIVREAFAKKEPSLRTPVVPQAPAPPSAPAPDMKRPSVEIKKLYDQMLSMKQDNAALHRQVDVLAFEMEELKKNNVDLVDKLRKRPHSAHPLSSASTTAANSAAPTPLPGVES